MDRKVENWFSLEQNRASDYLLGHGFKFSKSRNLFYKKIHFKGDLLDLRVQFPQNYPLEYPKFFIDSSEWYLNFPHVESYITGIGSSICYLADTDKAPFLDGEKIIQVELDRILEIITQYEREEYELQDFLVEFDSYWNDKIFYFDPNESMMESQIIDAIFYEGFGHVFTNNKEATSKKFEILKRKEKYTLRALFLPLLSISSPLPITRNKFVEILKQKRVYEYVQENFAKKDISPILLFSFDIKNSLHYAAVKFPQLESGSQKVVFPLFSPDINIERIRVKRLDRDRIFTRGGSITTQNIARNDIKIAIIGCGALGGSLAFKLAKNGIRNFILIDNQELSIDNIGRHICGMKYVGNDKVNAVKEIIIEQIPDCNIEIYRQNIMENLSLLESANFIVSALGSDGTTFEHFYNQIGNKPRIYTWFEGHIAGHSVLIKDTPNVDMGKLNENIRVVKDGFESQLNIKETGCNEFYTPYSYLDAEQTVNMAARHIINYVEKLGDVEENVLTTLCDIHSSAEMIKEAFLEYSSYSVISRVLKEVI